MEGRVLVVIHDEAMNDGPVESHCHEVKNYTNGVQEVVQGHRMTVAPYLFVVVGFKGDVNLNYLKNECPVCHINKHVEDPLS